MMIAADPVGARLDRRRCDAGDSPIARGTPFRPRRRYRRKCRYTPAKPHSRRREVGSGPKIVSPPKPAPVGPLHAPLIPSDRARCPTHRGCPALTAAGSCQRRFGKRAARERHRCGATAISLGKSRAHATRVVALGRGKYPRRGEFHAGSDADVPRAVSGAADSLSTCSLRAGMRLIHGHSHGRRHTKRFLSTSAASAASGRPRCQAGGFAAPPPLNRHQIAIAVRHPQDQPHFSVAHHAERRPADQVSEIHRVRFPSFESLVLLPCGDHIVQSRQGSRALSLSRRAGTDERASAASARRLLDDGTAYRWAATARPARHRVECTNVRLRN